ncbi:transglycosylase SLT domain-containing protein [Pectobacterium versatile]|uniref:transglycosylase SLT domain-containing protein n=1 Tax=Pectobacterium versatile TaxID=2488639 RepID=UPI001CF5A338|nr:transglycosylase SLT domain-containing protein [Pectobacterium versatile]MCA6927920.1 lytic transglycosylase domain-containing protein [Pectobacterium versatile]MCH5084664.1 transglycosylase SLT domain-containing protein [Pectobacterium versatile]
MAQTIDELLVSLGLETDAKSFDQARAAFKGVTDNMLQMASALTAGFGFDKLTRQFAGFVSELDRFSRRNIIDPNNVLRWGYAFESMGGSVRDAMSAIEKLNSLRDDAREGRVNSMALRNAGINPYELAELNNPQSGLMWMSSQMQQLSNNPDALTKFTKALGLNTTEQDVLSKGPDWLNQQFEEYNKRGRMITPETIRIADEYNTAIQNITTNLEGLGNSISERLTPKLTDLANRADKWLTDNKQGIVEKLDQAMPYLEQAAKGIAILVAINAAQKGGKMFLSNLPILGAAAYAEYFYNDFDNIKDSASSSWDYNKRQLERGLNENLNYPVGDALSSLGWKNNPWRRPARVSSSNPNALDVPGNDPLNDIGYIKNYLAMNGVSNENERESLAATFSRASSKHRVPVNVLLGMAKQESGFNAETTGTMTEWGRARGIMQYLESTAGGLGIDPNNPEQAINAAAMQLRQRINRGESIEEAVAHHHAGPNRKLWGVKTADYVNRVGEHSEDVLAGYRSRPEFSRASPAGGVGGDTKINVTVDARGASDPAAIEEAARRGAIAGTRDGLAEAGRNLKLSQESDIQ